jgi:hypothetical protein
MGVIQELKDKLLGTEKQNKEASDRMKAEDAKDSSTVQAKVNKVTGYKKGGVTRADGCITKGHTKGKLV